MLIPTILLLVGFVCGHYSLLQTIDSLTGVEGLDMGRGMQYVGASYFDGTVRIFGWKDGKLSLHQTIKDGCCDLPAWDICMTDDYWLAVGYRTNPAIYVLDTSTQQFHLMQQLDEEFVYSMQMSADHQYLAVGNENYVMIYTLVNGKYQRTQQIASVDRVWSLSLTADGKELVVGEGSVVGVYVNIEGVFTASLTIIYDSSFKRVKMTDDHQCMVVGCRASGDVLVYRRVDSDLVLFQNITDIGKPLYSLDVSSDCTKLIVGSQDFGFYYESDGHSFEQVQKLPTDYESLMRSRFSMNNNFILLGSLTSTLYVYSQDSSHLTSQ